MWKYILKRLCYLFVVLLIVVSITFFLVHSIPGDPISAMVENLPEEAKANYMVKYGLDKPLIVQYFRFMTELFKGNLGESLRYPGRDVVKIAASYGPISFTVGGLSLLIGAGLGLILGIIAATHRNQPMDRGIILVALLGTTIPTFVIAAVLQYLFTVTWPIFPTTGWGTPEHMVLPIICMCVGPIASYARYMRSSVLETMSQDFILTAEAKGLSSMRTIMKHVLRNSLLPCITMFCTSVASIFSGSFIVESIFAIPGLGKYFIGAINDRDYSVVLGLNVIYTSLYVVAILVSDVLLSIADPRIRLDGKR